MRCRLGFFSRRGNINLIVVIWCGFAGDTGKTRQTTLGGADNPNWRTATTARATSCGVPCGLKATGKVLTLFTRVRPQVHLDVVI